MHAVNHLLKDVQSCGFNFFLTSKLYVYTPAFFKLFSKIASSSAVQRRTTQFGNDFCTKLFFVFLE